MRFFADNNIAPAIAEALNALSSKDGHEVHHLRKRFAASTGDLAWLAELGEEGDWVILSGDYRITRRPHERAAWLSSGLTAFFLARGWTTAGFDDQAWMLVRWWPHIVAQAARVEPGAGFEIPFRATGKFRILSP